jgi:hypothetical protein
MFKVAMWRLLVVAPTVLSMLASALFGLRKWLFDFAEVAVATSQNWKPARQKFT